MVRLTYVSVGLPPDIVSLYDGLAREQKISRAHAMRRVLEDHVSHTEKFEHPTVEDIKKAMEELIVQHVGRCHRDEVELCATIEPHIASKYSELLMAIFDKLSNHEEPTLASVVPPGSNVRATGLALRHLGITPKKKMVKGKQAIRITLDQLDRVKALLGRSE
jgi:hypothetical protein